MRILLIDDHTLFRQTLVPTLAELSESVTTIQAGGAQEALIAISSYHNFDLILLDIVLPDVDGISFIPTLREQVLDVPIILLSGELQPAIVQAGLDAGASGYIPKTTNIVDLKHAIWLVLKGERCIPLDHLHAQGTSPPMSGQAFKDPRLTPRQCEVLKMLSDGLPNKVIAHRLAVSEGTVKLHVSAILTAFDARNRTEAVREALRAGLLRERH